MFAAGIDYSTRAIDLVLVPIEGDSQPFWHRFPLEGPDAWERTRTVRRSLPGPTSQLWDEVIAFGLEEPRGQNAGVMYRVQGAILASLPHTALVHPLVPSEWRKAVGLKGNATKDEVALSSRLHGPHETKRDGICWSITWPHFADWPQDAHDAHCIALAVKQLLERGDT